MRVRKVVFAAALSAMLGAGCLVCPTVALAQSSTISVQKLAALTDSGRMVTGLKAGDEFWGASVVSNQGQSLQTVSWSMTLDGAQISYGSWVLQAGRSALFTSIDSSIVANGAHELAIVVMSGGIVVGQATVSLTGH